MTRRPDNEEPQTIRRGAVVNHTQFGKRLQRTASASLAWFVPLHGSGFQDGGCRVFAEALATWSEGRLAVECLVKVGDRRRLAQHFVATLGHACLDSDGLATRSSTALKLHHFEGPGRFRMAPVGRCTGVDTVLRCPDSGARLVADMRRMMGRFDPADIQTRSGTG